MKKRLASALLLAALALPAGAQCVMCYRSASSQNRARARVLNYGILILGAPPFLILAGFCGFVAYKNKQCGAGCQPADRLVTGPGDRNAPDLKKR